MNFSFKHPDQSPGFLLWQLTNQWQRLQRNALSKIGLTHGQFVVLANVLWLSSLPDNIVTQQQVGNHAKIDKMSMSDLVSTLIEKKLLQRSAHKNDKRAYSLTLTKKGHKQALKAIPIVEGIDKKFFTKQTTELVKLVTNLRQLINAKDNT
jgi:DNA-binding MarR family transcriptional regulator